MLEFVILMIVLDLIMKFTMKLHEGDVVEEPKEVKPHKDCYKAAYVCGNEAEWDFESLDDAMEFREWRLAGNKGNAIDFYEYKKDGND